MINRIHLFVAAIFLLSCTQQAPEKRQDKNDPLPSWAEGNSRQRIIQFVSDVTDPDSEYFIVEKDRIAVFDNDGTLWSEQPVYFQFFFAMDRIRAMADDHPEWKESQPFKGVLENDMDAVTASGLDGLLQLTLTSHSGMTTEAFKQIVREWIDTARHPTTGKLYREMVYQPMLELLNYLRGHGFQTYIVSGGGLDFMRAWAEEVYGIPPQQVIGSYGKMEFRLENGEAALVKLPEIEFIDDKEGKPIAIERRIGKLPVVAFGNSDGDLAMLQWSAAGEGRRLTAYIHHTDEIREWAYDRESHIGHLDKGLEEAREKDWLVVDMKKDWKKMYPHD